MALYHKGLDFEGLPWRFTERDRLSSTGYQSVPVLQHNGVWIGDSFRIAYYLDEAFPQRPLFPNGLTSKATAVFVGEWCDREIHGRLSPHVAFDVLVASHEMDKDYYRKSRECRFGRTLEELAETDPATMLPTILRPLEATFQLSTFLGGAAPDYTDYVVFGSLQWVNVVSRKDPIGSTSRTGQWFQRMLDLFDGKPRELSTIRNIC